VNDTTSTVDPTSRDEQIAGTYTYRLTRTCMVVCPYGQQHITNGFYIHLVTTSSRPSVYYKCLSSGCDHKDRALLKADVNLVKRWVKLETSEDTISTSAPSSSETDSDFDDMLACNVPTPPVTATDVDLPDIVHTELKHMLNILALAPAEPIDDKEELLSMAWLLKQGFKKEESDNDEVTAANVEAWNCDLVNIWGYLCERKTTKYSDQYRDKLWKRPQVTR